MNRAPSKNDTWWAEHQRTCGGTYTKIREPEDYGKKKGKEKDKEPGKEEKETKKGRVNVKNSDDLKKCCNYPKLNNDFYHKCLQKMQAEWQTM